MSGKIFKINKANNYPKNKYVHAYYEKEPTEIISIQTNSPISYQEILKHPTIIDLEKSDEETLYSYFKAIEKGLKIELEKVFLQNFKEKLDFSMGFSIDFREECAD